MKCNTLFFVLSPIFPSIKICNLPRFQTRFLKVFTLFTVCLRSCLTTCFLSSTRPSILRVPFWTVLIRSDQLGDERLVQETDSLRGAHRPGRTVGRWFPHECCFHTICFAPLQLLNAGPAKQEAKQPGPPMQELAKKLQKRQTELQLEGEGRPRSTKARSTQSAHVRGAKGCNARGIVG